MARKTITNKLRFEIFKRDSFKCQYCGKTAPDVVLEVDHINPVAKGGKNDILNLVTSCYDCNRGKSDRVLGENNELSKQRQQLEQLNERREQLRLMTKWKEELLGLEEEQIDTIDKKFSEKTHYGFSMVGRNNCAAAIKKFGFESVFDAVQLSLSQYLQCDKDGELTDESINKAFNMYPRICYNLKNQKGDDSGQLYYIRGIIRRRYAYCDDNQAIQLLRAALHDGYQISELKEVAFKHFCWTNWKNDMTEMIRT